MNLDQERRKLIFHIKVAQTPEQIEAIQKAVKAWMYKYPEDAVVQRVARELAAKEAWLKTKGKWR